MCFCEVPQISEFSRLQVHLNNNKKQNPWERGKIDGGRAVVGQSEAALKHQGRVPVELRRTESSPSSLERCELAEQGCAVRPRGLCPDHGVAVALTLHHMEGN